MKLLFTLWTVLVAATTLTQALLQSSKGDDHWAKGNDNVAKGNDTEAICNEFSLIGLDFAPVPGNCSQYVKCSLLEITVETCPWGKLFDKTSGVCKDAKHVHC